MSELELSFVDAFILRGKSDRVRKQLSKGRVKRSKLRTSLPHFNDFEPRWMCRVPPAEQTPELLLIRLRAAGAPDRCSIISAFIELDGREAELEKALVVIVGHKPGTILICIPDRLAYYEGEALGDRVVLMREGRPASGSEA